MLPIRISVVLLVLSAITITLVACFSTAYPAEPLPIQCPTPQPCKVIVLTPEEEQVLLGPKGVLASAVDGRLLDLLGFVTYFRDKIANAPQGTPQQPPEAKQ